MIFVTGATGLIGADLLRILAAQDVPVRIGVHATGRIPTQTVHEEVRVNHASDSSVRKALTGCETLFLLTSFGPAQFETEMRLVLAAVQAGVRKIVKISVPGIGVLRDNELIEHHRAIENEIRILGFQYVFLRPHPLMQDFAFHLGEVVREQGIVFKPAGESAVSYVDARDVALVAATALIHETQNGRTLFLTGPRALSNVEVARHLGGILGREVRYVDLKVGDARDALRNAGVDEASIDVLFALHPFEQTEIAARVTNHVEKVTGRAPRTFDQFAADYRWAFEGGIAEEVEVAEPLRPEAGVQDQPSA